MRGPPGGWFGAGTGRGRAGLLVAGWVRCGPVMAMVRARAGVSRALFRLVYSVRRPDLLDLRRRTQAASGRGRGLDVAYVYTGKCWGPIPGGPGLDPGRGPGRARLAAPTSSRPATCAVRPPSWRRSPYSLVASGHAPERIRTQRFRSAGIRLTGSGAPWERRHREAVVSTRRETRWWEPPSDASAVEATAAISRCAAAPVLDPVATLTVDGTATRTGRPGAGPRRRSPPAGPYAGRGPASTSAGWLCCAFRWSARRSAGRSAQRTPPMAGTDVASSRRACSDPTVTRSRGRRFLYHGLRSTTRPALLRYIAARRTSLDGGGSSVGEPDPSFPSCREPRTNRTPGLFRPWPSRRSRPARRCRCRNPSSRSRR